MKYRAFTIRTESDRVGICMCGEGFPSVGHNSEGTTHPIVGVASGKGCYSCGGELIDLGVRELFIDVGKIAIHFAL